MAFITKPIIAKNTRKPIEPRKFNTETIPGYEAFKVDFGNFGLDKNLNMTEAKKVLSELRQLEKGLQHRFYIASKLGEWLEGQATENNMNWEASQAHLFVLFDTKNFTANICSINKDLNMIGFYKYLKEQRSRSRAIKKRVTVGFDQNPEARNVKVTVAFTKTMNFYYDVEERWRIFMKETEYQNLDWKIYKIEQVNGCENFAKSQEELTIDTSSDLQQPRLIAMHFYLAMTDQFQVIDRWLAFFDKANSFSGTVCMNNVDFYSEGFLVYMTLFLKRWKFDKTVVKNERRNFKELKSDASDYVFRYMVPASMRISEIEVIHADFEFIGWIQNNEHGDKKWYIRDVSLICPPENKKKDEKLIYYAKQTVYDVTEGLTELINSKIEWYDAFTFLTKYFPIRKREGFKISICDLHPVNSNASYILWKRYNDWNRRRAYLEVETLNLDEIHHTEQEFQFTMKLKTHSVAWGDQDRYIDWELPFRLNYNYTVFELDYVSISCPKDANGNELPMEGKNR